LKINANSGVYFVKNLETGNFKIGCSHNVPSRIRSIVREFRRSSGEVETIRWIGFIQSDKYKDLEKVLHMQFSDKRTVSEWFAISDKDVQSIVRHYLGNYRP
jgi:hypothetical protein